MSARRDVPAARARSEQPPARVAREWLRRVEVEYRSAAVTQQVGLWLTEIGAPPSLIRAALRIAADEIAHAELSHRVYRAAGGREVPALVRESLTFSARHGPAQRELDVARACVEIFCLGETAAVRIFSVMRAQCTVPSARRALDRVLRDEVRHRDFGWTLLPWLLDSYGAKVRAHVTTVLPGALARIWRAYVSPTSGAGPAATEVDRAWGLIGEEDYVRAVDKTLSLDWSRRFAELGFEVASPSS